MMCAKVKALVEGLLASLLLWMMRRMDPHPFDYDQFKVGGTD